MNTTNPNHTHPRPAADFLPDLSKLKPKPDAEKLQAEFAAAEQERNIATLREDWGLPKRYKVCSVRWDGPWGDCFQKINARMGSGFMMALTGGRGTGKTQIGAELMRVKTGKLKSALYTTAIRFFMAIKATYKQGCSQTEWDVILDHRRPSLLVIDEVGKRGETAWENNLLYELINARYGDMKDTLLIDNRTKEEFDAAIGDSIVSRMQETGGVISCDWKSFRG